MISGDPQPPESIPGARLLFSLDPAVAHLNHGSFGAVPIPAQLAQQRLRAETEANPVRFFAHGLTDRIGAARSRLARFLEADPDGTALIDNVTVGTALVLQTIGLGPGDEVLRTDHGYGAVTLAVERECRRSGAVPRTVGIPLTASDQDIVARVRTGLQAGRTRLLIVDQVTSPTARLFPTAAVVAAAREYGVPVLVDAAHAPGMLPGGPTTTGADFWMGNLHKWAFAPRGTAVLVVREPWRSRIEPLVVSWEQESGFPLRLEWQGTRDYSAWLAAPSGLDVLLELGIDRVRAHNAALAAYGQYVVGRALGLTHEELPDPGGAHVSMRILPLPVGLVRTVSDAAALRQRIATELRAEVALNAWSGQGWLRLSAQVYNQPGEYEHLAERLSALLRAHGQR